MLKALFNSFALPQLPNAMYIVLLDKNVQWNDTKPGRGTNCFCGYAGSLSSLSYTNPLGLVAYSVNQHPYTEVCQDEAAHEAKSKGADKPGPSACWPQVQFPLLTVNSCFFLVLQHITSLPMGL